MSAQTLAQRKCTPSSMRPMHTTSSPINIAGALPHDDLVLFRGGRPRLASEAPLESGRAPLRTRRLLVQEDDRGACVSARDDGAHCCGTERGLRGRVRMMQLHAHVHAHVHARGKAVRKGSTSFCDAEPTPDATRNVDQNRALTRHQSSQARTRLPMHAAGAAHQQRSKAITVRNRVQSSAHRASDACCRRRAQ